MKKLFYLYFLLFPINAYPHPADRYCPGQSFPPDYEAAGLVGYDPITAPFPAHCEPYLPALCDDDKEFALKAKEYWHVRRSLLDKIHELDESMHRAFAYASSYSVRKRKPRPLIPGIDYEPINDGLHIQADFVSYWDRIIRNPETQACARWRYQGEWSRQTALDFIQLHIVAATAHLNSANARFAFVQESEAAMYKLSIKK